MKFNVYVGVLFEDRVRVVTAIDGKNKYAEWTAGEEGQKMSLKCAKDLAWALTVNGYNAMVIQTLLEYSNPEEEE